MRDQKPCQHPAAQRWQYPEHWLCCACYRSFWGDKRETPGRDVLGWPTIREVVEETP